MPTVAFELSAQEIAVDKSAAASVNFCALWPTAKPILQSLAAVVSSSIVKFAINTVISAGDGYCGTSASPRLAKFGISIPPGAPPATDAFLSGLSDAELTTLAAVQQKARPNAADDFGSNFF